MNPFPPASATDRCRATVSGSSGRGKGMRSMMTSWQVVPGTSTPCHSREGAEQARVLVVDETPGEFGQLRVALAQDGQLRELLAGVHRSRLRRPARGERPKRDRPRPRPARRSRRGRSPTARRDLAAATGAPRTRLPGGRSRTGCRRRALARARVLPDHPPRSMQSPRSTRPTRSTGAPQSTRHPRSTRALQSTRAPQSGHARRRGGRAGRPAPQRGAQLKLRWR